MRVSILLLLLSGCLTPVSEQADGGTRSDGGPTCEQRVVVRGEVDADVIIFNMGSVWNGTVFTPIYGVAAPDSGLQTLKSRASGCSVGVWGGFPVHDGDAAFDVWFGVRGGSHFALASPLSKTVKIDSPCDADGGFNAAAIIEDLGPEVLDSAFLPSPRRRVAWQMREGALERCRPMPLDAGASTEMQLVRQDGGIRARFTTKEVSCNDLHGDLAIIGSRMLDAGESLLVDFSTGEGLLRLPPRDECVIVSRSSVVCSNVRYGGTVRFITREGTQVLNYGQAWIGRGPTKVFVSGLNDAGAFHSVLLDGGLVWLEALATNFVGEWDENHYLLGTVHYRDGGDELEVEKKCLPTQ